MVQDKLADLVQLLDGAVTLEGRSVSIQDRSKLQEKIELLVKKAVLDPEESSRALARYLVRVIAGEAGAYPSSIHGLYMARGSGKVPNTFTVPAINLRSLTFYAARIIFNIAKEIDAGAFIFEIARSETGYTDQRPAEYAANILGAAVAAGYQGPIFIQGDHYQVSASRYQNDPETELAALKDLTREAIHSGFFNIDVDTSTLVDLSVEDVVKQQVLNSQLSAHFIKVIRDLEPEGVTISVGGEIGEVGEENSTEEELRAYLDSLHADLEKVAPGAIGLSKISVLTGTSHGGVVLPDGSIKKVAVDFDLLQHLGRVARESYGLGGAVQHGASTLPESDFGKFPEYDTLEIHLATNFQNILYNEMDPALRSEIYAYLDENHANERKEGQTDEQFYYKTRKRALGIFKKSIWNMAPGQLEQVFQAWDVQFRDLFKSLAIADTRKYVDQHIQGGPVPADLDHYLKGEKEQEDTSDLAD